MDLDAATIRSWGLLNDADSKGRLIPHPTAVVLDRRGIVRYLFVETNYRLRPAAEELVRQLEELEPTGDPPRR